MIKAIDCVRLSKSRHTVTTCLCRHNNFNKITLIFRSESDQTGKSLVSKYSERAQQSDKSFIQ